MSTSCHIALRSIERTWLITVTIVNYNRRATHYAIVRCCVRGTAICTIHFRREKCASEIRDQLRSAADATDPAYRAKRTDNDRVVSRRPTFRRYDSKSNRRRHILVFSAAPALLLLSISIERTHQWSLLLHRASLYEINQRRLSVISVCTCAYVCDYSQQILSTFTYLAY